MIASLAQLSAVTRDFEGSDGSSRSILRGADLTLAAGESVAIVGPSGCGKSTLLNIIGGLLPPTSGSVCVHGIQLEDLDEQRLDSWRNREVGFVFQSHHLLPQCTALENVLVPTLVHPDRGVHMEGRARKLLKEVGLEERMDQTPGQLSGGERQRVAVVRALINGPRLILADEPTGALDGEAAEHLGQLLVGLQKSHGVAVLAVTHSPKLAAMMDRTLRLTDGILHAETTV